LSLRSTQPCRRLAAHSSTGQTGTTNHRLQLSCSRSNWVTRIRADCARPVIDPEVMPRRSWTPGGRNLVVSTVPIVCNACSLRPTGCSAKLPTRDQSPKTSSRIRLEATLVIFWKQTWLAWLQVCLSVALTKLTYKSSLLSYVGFFWSEQPNRFSLAVTEIVCRSHDSIVHAPLQYGSAHCCLHLQSKSLLCMYMVCNSSSALVWIYVRWEKHVWDQWKSAAVLCGFHDACGSYPGSHAIAT
jgi:hypothetical protein